MPQVIEIENLNVTYAPKTPLERKALQDVRLTVEKGEFRAVIGPQGSGKSTLMQVLAGLIPGDGRITVAGYDLSSKRARSSLWRKVGAVFQYPERQLFEDTVYNDVAYGPVNLGLNETEVELRVKEALEQVHLGEQFYQVSPYKLSGGQQRRAAIAGILAMRPEVLLLDEPTAGLDPLGRRQLMDMFYDLCKKKKVTVVLVTHDMEEVAHRADAVTVLNRGRVAMEGTPREIFSRGSELKEFGLTIPFASELAVAGREKGLPLRKDIITMAEAEREVIRLMGNPAGSGC